MRKLEKCYEVQESESSADAGSGVWLATPAVRFELYPWSDQASESLGIRPQGAIALHIKFTRKEQTSLPALGFKGRVSEY